MTILLTGFTPFGDHAINPSQLIVEALGDHDDVKGVVLPTIYQTAADRIVMLIEQHQPHSILMLGVASKTPTIALERFAVNINDAKAPDNAGDLRCGQPIVSTGPAAYTSTLPIATMHQALQEQAIPVAISNHAGAYVCNHLFYVAQHAIQPIDPTIPCGFIHVPSMDGELSVKTMIAAITICLDVLTH